MHTARRRVALAALVLLLATGCTPTLAVPGDPTGDELDRLIERELAFQWQYVGLTPDAPRPEVERIRIVSMGEAETVHRQCMVDAGYENFNVITGAIYGGASTEQREAIYTCIAQYPTPPASFGLFSEAQLEYLYDYYLEVTVPCIEANGVPVPAVPSREEFLVPSTQLKQVWTPYYSVESEKNVQLLMIDRCRYIPEGFPPF